MQLTTFVERARTALSMPTLYWLGHGGWVDGQTATTQPGRPIDLDAALEEKRVAEPKVYQEYIDAELKYRIVRATLPKIACDCSGYVCWALQIARNGWPGPANWFDTNGMVADANREAPQLPRYFVPLERAVPGALIIYPKPPGDNGPGHVGIVTEVDASGAATRVLHCSPYNYPLTPPTGLERNAIADTDMRVFKDKPNVQYIKWKAFA